MAEKEFTYAQVESHKGKKDMFVVIHDKGIYIKIYINIDNKHY